MKNMKKLIYFVLIATLLLGALTGCAEKGARFPPTDPLPWKRLSVLWEKPSKRTIRT